MSKALLRFIRLSPTKAHLVAREIQGMNAEIALASLEFTPNKAARVIAKVVASAIANGGYEANNVVIHSCRVDAGPVLRRFMPRARGRATPIRKPTSHVFVEVMTQSEIDAKKASSKSKTKALTQNKAESSANETSKKANKSTKAQSTQTPAKKPQTKVAKSSASTTKQKAKKTEGEDK